MSLPGLDDLQDLGGARVLVRLDLNVPVKDGVVLDETRIQAALPTIRYLVEAGARLALCSHLGKAKGSPDPAYSLQPVAGILGDALGLGFQSGGASLDLASGRRAAGLLMSREVAALRRVVVNPEQPFVAIVGGAKISTKIAPLEALLGSVRRLLIGGGMANTFFMAQGLPIGRSLVEEDMLETAREVIKAAAAKGIELLLPSDVVVTDTVDGSGWFDIVAADAVAPNHIIVDLGPDSRQRYANAIEGARTVFWNGPMGVFEVDAFAVGTLAIAHAMADCGGFTVVGGGESVMAAVKAGVEDRMSHVSTGGGASLEFITGEPLPALTALEDQP